MKGLVLDVSHWCLEIFTIPPIRLATSSYLIDRIRLPACIHGVAAGPILDEANPSTYSVRSNAASGACAPTPYSRAASDVCIW